MNVQEHDKVLCMGYARFCDLVGTLDQRRLRYAKEELGWA
jgi:hypothetical protein